MATISCSAKDASVKAVSIAAAAAIAVAAPMVAPDEAFARDVAPYADERRRAQAALRVVLDVQE